MRPQRAESTGARATAWCRCRRRRHGAGRAGAPPHCDGTLVQDDGPPSGSTHPRCASTPTLHRSRDAAWDLIKNPRSPDRRKTKAMAINCAGRRGQHQVGGWVGGAMQAAAELGGQSEPTAVCGGGVWSLELACR